MFERCDICACVRISLLELQAIQIDVMCWSVMEVRKSRKAAPAKRKEYCIPIKSMKWHESMMAVMLVDLTWSNYSQLCTKSLLMPIVAPVLLVVRMILFIGRHVNMVLEE